MSDLDPDVELELFRQFRRTPTRPLRNEIVERYVGFATHIAKRYSRTGVDDDVRQVALYGLVKAVDRFDPAHGSAFTAFAGVTIEGEIKRHFRDKTWKVRVPRRAKELHLLVRDAGEELASRLGRSPSLDEIAEHLGVERDEVMRGLSATAAYSVGSIDSAAPVDGDLIDTDRQAVLATDEAGFEERVDQQLVGELLEILPERERRIVELRFYHDMSQSEIAKEMGISQMHVSRLLRRSFQEMRHHAGGPPDEAAAADPI